MKNNKRILSFVLSALLICGVFISTIDGTSLSVKAVNEPSYAGSNWSYSNGELLITGNVKVTGEGNAPWYSYANSITKVSLYGNVTKLDGYIFEETNISKIYIPETVTSISENAFKDCDELKTIYYGSTSSSWGSLQLEVKDVTVKYNHLHKNGAVVNKENASCNAEGYTGDYYCQECECLSVKGSVLPAAHNWKDEKDVIKPATCSNNVETLAIVCLDCGAPKDGTTETITKDVDHIFGEVAKKSESECGKGTYIAKCINCDETIEKATEEHDYVNTTVIPTCTTEGYTLVTCKYCEVIREENNKVPPIGHVFKTEDGKDNIIKKDATCTEDGEEYIKCVNCDELEESIHISALGHTESVDWEVIVAPTCTKNGIKAKRCTTCGEIMEETKTEIPNNHSDEQLDVEYVIDPVNYPSTKEPTCRSLGYEIEICKICNEPVLDKNGNEKYRSIKEDITKHTADEWKVDSKLTNVDYCKYVKKCKECRMVLESRDHEWVNDNEVDCTDGGVLKQHCKYCNEKRDTIVEKADSHECIAEVVQPTCTEKGYTIQKCTHCSYTSIYNEVASTGHTFKSVYVAPTCKPGRQYDKCEKCGAEENIVEIPAGEHIYEPFISKKATCTEAGHKYDICKYCRLITNHEDILQIAHNNTTTIDLEPTCTEPGRKTTVCSMCNNQFSEIIPATGHSLGEIKKVAATCTENGKTYRECSNCGERMNVIDKNDLPLGHSYIKDAAVEPTCTEKGKTEGSHCSRCDEVEIAQNEIPEKGHTIETIPAKDSDCTKKGNTEGKFCIDCKATIVKSEPIAEKPHNLVVEFPRVDPTCEEPGFEEQSRCTVCGRVFPAIVVEIPRLGIYNEETGEYDHASIEIVERKEPTCTEDGMTEGIYCSTCNEIISAETIIPALGHDWSKPVYEWNEDKSECTATTECANCGEIITETATSKYINVPMTCLNDGYESYVVSFNNSLFGNYSDTTPFKAPGKHEEDEIKSCKPTCTTDGFEKGIVCSVCGEELVKQSIIPATGHKKSAKPVKENIVEAKCGEKGSYNEVYKCSECNAVMSSKKVSIPALEHKYGNAKITKEATAFKKGVMTSQCEFCGKKQNTDYNLTILQKIVWVFDKTITGLTGILDAFNEWLIKNQSAL